MPQRSSHSLFSLPVICVHRCATAEPLRQLPPRRGDVFYRRTVFVTMIYQTYVVRDACVDRRNQTIWIRFMFCGYLLRNIHPSLNRMDTYYKRAHFVFFKTNAIHLTINDTHTHTHRERERERERLAHAP